MNDDYCYKASIAKLLLLVANRGGVDDYRNGQGPRTQLFKIILDKFSKIFLGVAIFALMKLGLEILWKLQTAIINRPMRLQLIICHKKELLSSLSSIKLVLICNKCYQCKLVGIMINEWCEILTTKIFTKVNKT